jgi:tetratricopeptide (TPR) repeat protein
MNKPYLEHLHILKDSLRKEPNNANLWNVKDILSICILAEPSDDKLSFSDTGGYHDAINCYNEATRLDPDYFQAWTNKGLAYLEGELPYEKHNSKYKKAISCFDTAIKCFENAKREGPSRYALREGGGFLREEDYSNMYNNLGICYYELREYDEAISCFEKAIEICNYLKLAEHNKEITVRKKQNGNIN